MARSRRPWLASWLCVAVGVVLLAGPAEARTRSYAVLEAQTGIVIKSVNADVQLHPASMTKMMTLYLVYEAVGSGKLSMDQRVKVSRYASRIPPSRLGLRQGQRILVRHLVSAAAVRSANDAAVVLAEAVAGSEKEFARRMTRKARELGMYNTTFKNATGFTTKGHLSTARDMAILGRRLVRDFPQYAKTYKRRYIRWGGRKISATNTRFLNAYAGADGIKTGYTRAAGYTIVASARRGGRHLIVSYFGASSSARRTRRVAQIFNDGFALLKREGPALLTRAAPAVPPPRPGGSQTVVAVAVPTVSTEPSEFVGGWQVQVGAFGTSKRAERHANNIASKHASLIGSGRVQVAKDGKLHVVRLAGYDRSTARQVCRGLKRARAECFVLAQPAAPRVIKASAPAKAPSVSVAAAGAAPRSDGHWAVQVGAYSRVSGARRRIDQIRQAKIDALAGHDFTVRRSGRYYLARFTGFDGTSAAAACATLKAKDYDCLAIETRVAGGAKAPQLADASGEWAIRVATFRRESSARKELNRVRGAKLDVLAGKEAQLLRAGGRTQVRFNGFNRNEARSSCDALSRRGFACLPVLRKKSPAVQSAAAGGWAIQVGAYGKASAARAQIQRVEGRDLKVLQQAEAWVPKQGRYYLARFRNLDKQRANDACSALTERGVECLALTLR